VERKEEVGVWGNSYLLRSSYEHSRSAVDQVGKDQTVVEDAEAGGGEFGPC
jgi:hypothetical protein